MEKMKSTEKIVLEVLQESPLSRKDDCVLMWWVCYKINQDILGIPFGEVMLLHKKYGLPNLKTIERARRRIQKKHPELIDPETDAIRTEEMEKYRAYAGML